MDNILLYVVVALGVSTLLNIGLKQIKISPIIGYIFTGIIITYFFHLQKYADSEGLAHISEFGIVFLMFTIGLEISFNKMRTMKMLIFGNGIAQVSLTALGVFAISHYIFTLDFLASVIIALAFSLSSTAVVLTYLKQSKEIYTSYGQRTTGILIFQDIAVIPIMILISFLSNEGNAGVGTILLDTFGSAFFVLLFMFSIGRKIIEWLLHFSATSELDELFMASVLFIVTATSLLAHFMGFTYSLGAFIAGMIIAETKYHYKVESDIAPFKDILLGIFFVVVGMKVDISVFINNFGVILALFAILFLLKTLITFIVVAITYKPLTGLKTGFALAQVGEFAFVIFALATQEHLLDANITSLLVLTVIFSMLVTPFFIPHVKRVAEYIIRSKSSIPEVVELMERKNHIIICGYGAVGKFVAKDLDTHGMDYIIIDNSPKHVKEALNQKRESYLGDMSKRAILEALHVKDATAVIVTLDNADKKQLICEAILEQTREVNIIVKVISKEERVRLKKLKIPVIVNEKMEVAKVLVERAIHCQLNLYS
ncbi:Glutathione-regulated potassium-efflux system protein KefB [hydrothermal vent metagenome]|uniref:Glutathione-regulated potassium-efflux system protein KefB n=1 Tax=hydrothermal vent metagenome TaxID=652676 RepID=A0A1W1CFF0_9ZZZZ